MLDGGVLAVLTEGAGKGGNKGGVPFVLCARPGAGTVDGQGAEVVDQHGVTAPEDLDALLRGGAVTSARIGDGAGIHPVGDDDRAAGGGEVSPGLDHRRREPPVEVHEEVAPARPPRLLDVVELELGEGEGFLAEDMLAGPKCG